MAHTFYLPLPELFLINGVNPNDGEARYLGCDLGAPALRLLLQHGADIGRTNALLGTLDCNELEMVEVLLDRGADSNEDVHWPETSGDASFVKPALHQLAACVRAKLSNGCCRPDSIRFCDDRRPGSGGVFA